MHPTPVYAAALAVCGCLIFLAVERRVTAARVLLPLAIVLWSLQRFVVDFFRFYPPSQKLAGFTYNQWLALAFVAVAVAAYWWLRRIATASIRSTDPITRQ